MTWASTDIIPTTANLSSIVSNANGILDRLIFKLTPRNSSNALFDFTAATAAAIDFVNTVTGVAISNTNGAITPTIVAHDATGLTLSIAAADLTGAATGLGSNSASLTVTATDGTTNLLIATGTLRFLGTA